MFARALLLAVAVTLAACGPSAPPIEHPVSSESVAREAFLGFNGAEHQFLSDTSGPYMARHWIACGHGSGTVTVDERRMITTAYDTNTNVVHILDQPSSSASSGLRCEGDQPIIGTFNDAKTTVTSFFAPIVNSTAYGAVNNGAAYMACRLGTENRDTSVEPYMNIATIQANTLTLAGPYKGDPQWVNRIDYRAANGCIHTIVARYTRQN